MRALFSLMRYIYVAGRELQDSQLTLRAMSLVYTTLLGLVPLLAVSFSVLKAFGVRNLLEPLLLRFLAPLGPEAQAIAEGIVRFVERVDVSVLGSLGLLFLLYTVVSIIQKIEESLNYIWKIRKERGIMERFSDYLTIIFVGPVVVFAVLGLTASVSSAAVVQRIREIEHFGPLFLLMGRVVPYLFIIAFFTYIYIFLPNTKVHFRSALVGGTTAGIMWQAAGQIFASFIAGSTKYSGIYSGFAIIIFFMLWLFLSWRIFLVGASVSFYHQFPFLVSIKREPLSLSSRLKERLALIIMYLVGKNFTEGGEKWTLKALVEKSGVPMDLLNSVILILEKKGLLTEVAGDSASGFFPGKDLDGITIKEILEAVRTAGEEVFSIEEDRFFIPQVDREFRKIEEAVAGAIDKDTLKDLIVKGAGSNI